MLRYVGIDLGQKGSISVQLKPPFKSASLKIHWFWGRFGGTRLRTATRDELVLFLDQAIPENSVTYVAIEHPVLMPKNGKKSVAGMFENYGFFMGYLYSKRVAQIWTPTPQQWKKEVGAPGSDKTKMVNQASKLFRDPGINTETADSVLISEACRLRFKGQ